MPLTFLQFLYKAINYYSKKSDRGLLWFDSGIDIDRQMKKLFSSLIKVFQVLYFNRRVFLPTISNEKCCRTFEVIIQSCSALTHIHSQSTLGVFVECR
jgi:hypothetical protein